MQKIIPIIMAGGSGTRLWPVSRDSLPKQFIALLDHGLSTFQTTLQRVNGPVFDTPIVITSQDVRFITADQILHVGMIGDIVLEPERRDSAAAVGSTRPSHSSRSRYSAGEPTRSARPCCRWARIGSGIFSAHSRRLR